MSRLASPFMASATDRAMVLDCLRIRDVGGDWLGHASFDTVRDRDATTASLVRDGLAVWDEFGVNITPRGRQVWADQRITLRNLAEAIEAAEAFA